MTTDPRHDDDGGGDGGRRPCSPPRRAAAATAAATAPSLLPLRGAAAAIILLALPTLSNAQQCTAALADMCTPCCDADAASTGGPAKRYNCSLPGLESFAPGGQYENVKVNYLSFVTETSSPNFPVRAGEFEACTGGKIVFAEAENVWEDPIADLGTKTSTGQEVFDGYFMSYSHFPEASALDLAEHLNDRVQNDNDRLKWEDVFAQVKAMGEYRKDGKTNLDFLMYDGDFFVPLIRLDLLEKHDPPIPLPNTWEEVVAIAKLFNGTDLNGDGDPNDFGFCHFPRLGAGYWDWWWPEALYSTWATYSQTEGRKQGFFFDENTMEPKIDEAFDRAAEFWKDLWLNGEDGCITNHFTTGRCAIGFSPPGCWKGIFLSHPDGVSRKDEDGNVVWRPTMKDGSYAEPYRFRPFGTTEVLDHETGQMVKCTPEICPKAERIPPKGHRSDPTTDRAEVLPPSPLEGQLVNRAPFYWSGGLGTLIRKSSEPVKKDLMWDFFVYTNSPDTSVYDVANYASWLDEWRFSQLATESVFTDAGWSPDAYGEHSEVMLWALRRDVNGAFNLRIPGLKKYTHDVVGAGMGKYIDGEIPLGQLTDEVRKGWNDVTAQEGTLDQLEIYRAALGMDALSEYQLCQLHRSLMDERDPSVCRQYDPATYRSLLPAIIVPVVVVLLAAGLLIYVERKRRRADAVWTIKPSELIFDDPPEVIGRGTFGLVLLAEYRGTEVAVKRVIPPKVAQKEGLLGKMSRRYSGGSSVPSVRRMSSRRFSGESSVPSRRNSFGSTSKFSDGGSDSFLDVAQDSFNFDRAADVEEGAKSGSYKVTVETNGSDAADKKTGIASADTAGTKSLGTKSGSGTLSSAFVWKRKKDDYSKLKADFVEEMRTLSKLRHPCITTVMGAIIERNQEPMLVMEYMDHGSLFDLLHNETVLLEGEVLLPILKDIAQGVRFLHAATPQVIHGDLKAANVLVDSKFRAKVADFGLSQKKKVGATGTPFWMAPELLRGESDNTSASDVYAFGIILYEVYSRKVPYAGEDFHEVVKLVCDPEVNKRPGVPPAMPLNLQVIMSECLVREPMSRPTYEELDHRLRRLDVATVEPGDMHLTMQLRKIESNKGTANVNFENFPRHIAEALQDGRKVEPEHHEVVTIFFCDIVGYTNMCSVLSAVKVSDLLDRLYNAFDDLSHKHDVFKVETIGDAYMAVTNLVKDQSDHAKRIVDFSRDAMEMANQTPVDVDDPSMGFVNIRVGFHSGPVVSNVVGSRNLKFSIFGDTVNVASRMESNSKKNRIHCSERAAKLVMAQAPNVPLKCRGSIQIKGKGEMVTYWVGSHQESKDKVRFDGDANTTKHGEFDGDVSTTKPGE